MKLNDEIVLRSQGIIFLLIDRLDEVSTTTLKDELLRVYNILNKYEYEDIII